MVISFFLSYLGFYLYGAMRRLCTCVFPNLVNDDSVVSVVQGKLLWSHP